MQIFLPYILNSDYFGLLDLAIEKWSPILDGLARTLSIQGQVINDSGKMIRRVWTLEREKKYGLRLD